MWRQLILGSAAVLAACSSSAKPPVVAVPPPGTPTPTAPAVADALSPPLPALRLPQNFVPTGYTARLVLDPAATTFDGELAIAGAVSARSSVIWLHGRHLKIRAATATHEGAAPVALEVTPHGEDLLALHAATPLEAGAWTLHFTYGGEFDESATAGAFRQTVGADHYVYSQLEALYARRVFPCVDEPGSKVPWQLTLDVPTGLVAVSNMPEAHREALDATHQRVTFAPTPPVPSYLVAFGVGPFEIIDGGTTKAGVRVRAITLHGRGADAAYAAKTTAGVLDVLTEYFGIPYPYPKLDVLTIPLTVGFSAMENSGLVTFAEGVMLFDQKHPSLGRQHTWIVVAAHELAHQWFGDYVTTAWWDDIWLNEGFANWMELKASAKLVPAWHDELSELDTRDGALNDDGLTSARKIRQPIEVVDDIETAFDGITYDKGASVLNMFESYLGHDTFQKGVRSYLQSRAFGNATSADFVTAMTGAAGKDLTHAFGSFLDQAGAPEIAATVACTGGGPRVQLAQRRYVPVGAPPPAGEQQWIVPVCVAYDRDGSRGEACTMLDTPTAELALPAKACPRWVMPNVGGRGYFHIVPTAPQVTALRDEGWAQLSWPERRALYTDVTEAAEQGRLPLTLALSFVPKLLAGGDRFTIGDAVGLPYGLGRFVPDELRPKYEAWLRATFGAGAAKAGLLPKDGDDLDVEGTRGSLVAAVASAGREPVLVGDAVKLAATWRDLSQAVRGEILGIACDASADVFDRTLREVVPEKERSNRDEMLRALASVRDPARHLAALGLVIDPRVDIRESMWMLFGGRTVATRDASQKFFRDHQVDILARVPHDDTTGEAVHLSGIFTASCDASRRDEVVTYVHATFDAFPGAARALAQEIEGMDQCIARRKLLEPQLRGWLGGVKIAKPAAAVAAPAPAATHTPAAHAPAHKPKHH